MRMIALAMAMLSILVITSRSDAANFDGSNPLLCVLMKAMECTAEFGCDEVTVASINARQFLKVDFKNMTIKGAGDDTRQSSIENLKHIDGKLIIQGEEDGLEGVRDGVGWTAAIMEDSGKVTLTASGDEVGFVLFGACINQ